MGQQDWLQDKSILGAGIDELLAQRELSLPDAVAAISKGQVTLLSVLMRLHGEVRAMKVVLDAVVGAHPEPERLYELWQQALPDITEGLTASDARYTPAQREGGKHVLRYYSEYFRVLHDRAREQDDE